MTPERHARIAEVFRQALTLPEAERARYVATTCADDPTLVEEVAQLLHHDAQTFSALDALEASETSLGSTPTPRAGTSIGEFRIVKPLGEGGMAIVMEAEQAHPRRAVALKILRASFPSKEQRERFRLEADILAQLDHAGIARVYAASGGDGDREPPWLAMELIDGVAFDDHVLSNHRDQRTVAGLVAALADAVEHAHQRGVVHRDLKPSNILVDARGTPRILDFGVSQVVQEGRPDARVTHTGQVIGTLAYMSPEQAEGSSAIDGRADLYALGVILYEALSGALPIDVRECSFAEATRRIVDRKPPGLRSLRPELDPDLATIAARALDKSPELRFQSASELAAELRRFLRHEPILSRPPSTLYALKRFARRHRRLVVAAAAVALALATAALVAVSFAIRAGRERDRADRASRESATQARIAKLEVAASEGFVEFVLGTLQAMDPTTRRQQEPTLREAMDELAAKVDTTTTKPEILARIHGFLGDMYRALGRDDQAALHLERAAALYDELPALDLHAAQGFYRKGWFALTQSELDEAARRFRQVLSITAKRGDGARGLDADATVGLGEVALRRGEIAGARELVERALAIRRARGEGDLEPAAVACLLLSQIAIEEEKPAEAKALAEESLRIRRALHGNLNPLVAESLQQVASAEYELGHLAESRSLQVEVLGIQEATLGAAHPTLASGYFNLANLDYAENRYAEALEWMRKAAGALEALGETHRIRAPAEQLTGLIHLGLGDPAKAHPHLRRALGLLEQQRGPNHGEVLALQRFLGVALVEAGETKEGLAILEQLEAKLKGFAEVPAELLRSTACDVLRTRATLAEAKGDAPGAAALRAQADALEAGSR